MPRTGASNTRATREQQTSNTRATHVHDNSNLQGSDPVVAALAMWLQLVVGLWVLALLWRALVPGFCRQSVRAVRARPGRSLLVGLGSFILVPLVLALVAAVGAIVGGWWLALLGSCAWIVVLVLAVAVAALTAVDRIVPPGVTGRRARWAVLPAVLALMSLVFVLPVVGPVAALLVVWLGLGGLVLAGRGAWRTRQKMASTRVEPHPAPA